MKYFDINRLIRLPMFSSIPVASSLFYTPCRSQDIHPHHTLEDLNLMPLCFYIAGMCLLDTVDAALMLTLYTTPSLSSSPIATLYYSIVLTTITLIVALVIGILQFLTLIFNVTSPKGKFWDGVQVAGDHYDVIGSSFPASNRKQSRGGAYGI